MSDLQIRNTHIGNITRSKKSVGADVEVVFLASDGESCSSSIKARVVVQYDQSHTLETIERVIVERFLQILSETKDFSSVQLLNSYINPREFEINIDQSIIDDAFCISSSQ